jgi:hypothetical protein
MAKQESYSVKSRGERPDGCAEKQAAVMLKPRNEQSAAPRTLPEPIRSNKTQGRSLDESVHFNPPAASSNAAERLLMCRSTEKPDADCLAP